MYTKKVTYLGGGDTHHESKLIKNEEYLANFTRPKELHVEYAPGQYDYFDRNLFKDIPVAKYAVTIKSDGYDGATLKFGVPELGYLSGKLEFMMRDTLYDTGGFHLVQLPEGCTRVAVYGGTPVGELDWAFCTMGKAYPVIKVGSDEFFMNDGDGRYMNFSRSTLYDLVDDKFTLVENDDSAIEQEVSTDVANDTFCAEYIGTGRVKSKPPLLTIGARYLVEIVGDDGTYGIRNDNGDAKHFPATWFKSHPPASERYVEYTAISSDDFTHGMDYRVMKESENYYTVRDNVGSVGQWDKIFFKPHNPQPVTNSTEQTLTVLKMPQSKREYNIVYVIHGNLSVNMRKNLADLYDDSEIMYVLSAVWDDLLDLLPGSSLVLKPEEVSIDSILVHRCQ